MRRLTPIVVFFMLPVAAGAAPLCHDLKGLYTPCAGAPRSGRAPAARRAGDPPALAATQPEPAREATAAPPSTTKRHPAGARPLVTRTRLCRDGKGLFTPCPR